MKYIKTYEAKKKDVYNSEYDFWKDYSNKKIRDTDHYLNIINDDKNHVYLSQVESLFHWSCYDHESKLALALSDELPKSSLIKRWKSIIYLDYKTYKTIMEKDDLYKYIIHRDKEFLSNIIYYGGDDVKKLILLQKWGFIFTQKDLENASYADKEKIVKYLVSIGLDPSVKTKTSYSESEENCLDKATSHNKTPNIIKYFVEKLNIPVTYRHMKNVISEGNLKALPILIKSKNLIPDYAYSTRRHGTYDNTQVRLYDIIITMIYKKLNKYIKILLNKETDYGYNMLVNMPSKKDSSFYNKKGSDVNERLYDNFLGLAYWIISKYNGVEREYITDYITRKHGIFWINKMKENPNIISKLTFINDKIARSYSYQKTILDADAGNLKYIINRLNPKIEMEYDYLINSNKYNL